jgi:hypothetical protein
MNLSLEAFFENTLRGLLRAYPPAFRERFSDEIAQVYHQLWRQVYQDSGTGGLLRLWLQAIG